MRHGKGSFAQQTLFYSEYCVSLTFSLLLSINTGIDFMAWPGEGVSGSLTRYAMTCKHIS